MQVAHNLMTSKALQSEHKKKQFCNNINQLMDYDVLGSGMPTYELSLLLNSELLTVQIEFYLKINIVLEVNVMMFSLCCSV